MTKAMRMRTKADALGMGAHLEGTTTICTKCSHDWPARTSPS